MSISSSSCATVDDTARHAARRVAEVGLGEWAFRRLGRTGLRVSAIGFGADRAREDCATHARALGIALERGCNVIDASTHHAEGGGERLAGRILAEACEDGRVRRGEVVLVSKVGYLQGADLDEARRREREGCPWRFVVRRHEHCWHCMDPDFLSQQLDASRRRLGVERIDGYLLHDPESFLVEIRESGGEISKAVQRELDERLVAAFCRLEEAADEGRIGCYGVSSSATCARPGDPNGISLERLLGLAEKAARARGYPPGDHRFSVLRVPLNLFETDAFLAGGSGRAGGSVLERAMSHDLGVLVSRPLDALVAGRVQRLADVPALQEHLELDELAPRVRDLEEQFRDGIEPALEALPGSGSSAGLFRWGEELPSLPGRLAGLAHWRQVEEELVVPRLEHALGHVDLHLAGPARARWLEWRDAYLPAVGALLKAVGERFGEGARRRAESIRTTLTPFLPERFGAASLSQQALSVVMGTPGVTSVTCGMRRPEHVHDAMGALEIEPPLMTADVYRGLGSALASA